MSSNFNCWLCCVRLNGIRFKFRGHVTPCYVLLLYVTLKFNGIHAVVITHHRHRLFHLTQYFFLFSTTTCFDHLKAFFYKILKLKQNVLSERSLQYYNSCVTIIIIIIIIFEEKFKFSIKLNIHFTQK
jgi:hypothetical protein